MPNHIGAFLKASECFAKLGINITRVSYNKAIDSHTLFIEAQGDEEKLLAADEELTAIGYLHSPKNENSIALLEFTLKDIPGSVTEVLRIIQDFGLNISYISSQENGTPEQAFKMGLFVEDGSRFQAFLEKRVQFVLSVFLITIIQKRFTTTASFISLLFLLWYRQWGFQNISVKSF